MNTEEATDELAWLRLQRATRVLALRRAIQTFVPTVESCQELSALSRDCGVAIARHETFVSRMRWLRSSWDSAEKAKPS